MEITSCGQITLRSFEERDMEALRCLLMNEEIKKTYMIPDFPDPQAADGLCRRFMALSRDESHFVRGICLDDALIGFLNDVEKENGRVEVGYVIHPAHWNRGYATRALMLAVEALFSLGFDTVRAGYFEENPASGRVMQKAGMKPIPFEDTVNYRGKTHRCLYYEISKR